MIMWFGLLLKILFPDTEWGIKTVSAIMSLLCVAEFISVLQNTIAIRKWEAINEYDAVTAVLNLILKKVRESLDKRVQ